MKSQIKSAQKAQQTQAKKQPKQKPQTTTKRKIATAKKAAASAPSSRPLAPSPLQFNTLAPQHFQPTTIKKNGRRFFSAPAGANGAPVPPPPGTPQQPPTMNNFQQQRRQFNQNKGPMNPFANKITPPPGADSGAVGANAGMAFTQGGARRVNHNNFGTNDDLSEATGDTQDPTLPDTDSFFSESTEESVNSELHTDDDGLQTRIEKFHKQNQFPFRIPKVHTDSEQGEIDPNQIQRPDIWDEGYSEAPKSEFEPNLKLVKRPKNARYNKDKPNFSDISEYENSSIEELSSDNSPEWQVKKVARTTHSIGDEHQLPDGTFREDDHYGDVFWSDKEELVAGYEDIADQANAMYPESDPNWDDFESLGTVGLLRSREPAAMKKYTDMVKVNKYMKTIPGPTKLELPRLKPGAKIPRGWMITEDGSCVPHTKEAVHFKYADPDLYQTPLHDRLADLVQDRLPAALKMTPQERESMLEVTSSGQHHAYLRHRERMLNNTAIDDVIAKINARRGPAKVMDFETNVDLSFKTQDLSPYRKVYRYRMTAQGHALMDIPDSMLFEIRQRKQRSPHRPSGPSMDYTFTSTAWHKGTH